MSTPTRTDPCFFILGYGRSGTTLFRRMLSAHPNLFVAPENDAFQRLPQLLRTGLADATDVQRMVEAFPPYYQRIYDIGAFADAAAARVPLSRPDTMALLQGSSRIGQGKADAQWGHKAPSEWPYLGTWREWFPHARFLHLVRHPHDSTASMNEYQLQRYRTTPLVSIWQWRKAFRGIRSHGAELGPERYKLLRYEDLVNEPASTLEEVCRFLGVPTDHVPTMVDFTSDPTAVHLDEGVHMERAETAVTQERIGRAASDYSSTQAAMLDYVCRRELETLGYAVRSDATATPFQRVRIDATCRSLDLAWSGVRATRRIRGQL